MIAHFARLVIEHVAIIFYFVLSVGVLAMILWALLFLPRLKTRKKQIDLYGKLATAVTALGGILLSFLNAIHPLVPTATTDAARSSIAEFYQALDSRNFDTAFGLLHPAKLDEIRRRSPLFDRNAFASNYSTDCGYQHLTVDTAFASRDTTSRVYRVMFDVCSDVPRSRLFELRQAVVSDLISRGLLNQKALISEISKNLDEYYVVPNEALPLLTDAVLSRRFESVLDPVFLVELHKTLADSFKLVDRKPAPSTSRISRHFVQEIQISKDGGNWRIRDGLYPPKAIATFSTLGAP